jgi:ubiquinone biosynthesis protein COQ4
MKHESGITLSMRPAAAESTLFSRLDQGPEDRLRRRNLTPLARWFEAAKSLMFMVLRKDRRVFYGTCFLMATEGNAFDLSLDTFRATPVGRELLRLRPDLWEILSNRSTLQACPSDSFGSWYVDHMTAFDLDEGHYLSLARDLAEHFEDDVERLWLRNRIDTAHDLRHVLAGYGNDSWGEVCLLSFRFGQTRHFGSLILSLFGLLGVRFTCRGPVLRSWHEAYRRGRDAKLLDSMLWENALDQPLLVVRAAMGLCPIKYYRSPVAPKAYFDYSGTAHSPELPKALTIDAV